MCVERGCGTHVGGDVARNICPREAVRAFLTWFDPGAARSWDRELTDEEIQYVYNMGTDGTLGGWRVEYVCDDHSSEFWHMAEFDPSAARELTLEEGLVAEVMCF